MQEITIKKDKKKVFLKVLTTSLLIVVLVYYIFFFVWAFDVSMKYGPTFGEFYAVINPFTIGAYSLGITVLLYYLLFKNAIIKAVLGTAYILIIIFSLVAIMGMMRISDLLIYAPHLFILVGCAVSLYRNKKRHISKPV